MSASPVMMSFSFTAVNRNSPMEMSGFVAAADLEEATKVVRDQLSEILKRAYEAEEVISHEFVDRIFSVDVVALTSNAFFTTGLRVVKPGQK